MRAGIRHIISMWIVCIALALSVQTSGAQTGDYRWTTPERLSSEAGQAGPPSMASDAFGYVHLFWAESGFSDGRPLVRYSRFDGETWSLPNDIFVGARDARMIFISPHVDSKGILHLLWSENNTGPMMYSRAPAHDAISAKNWLDPLAIDVPAFMGKLVVDSRGVLHVLYSDFYGAMPGIYYVRSENEGNTWSSPRWLDPDIPAGHGPLNVNFGIDQNDDLHAQWHYIEKDTANGSAIRYARSWDGGNTWTAPFSIDKADESFDELRMPYPEFIVNGEDVHIIWAGDSQTHREHRYSTNAGDTFSTTNRILGDLQGQALGGGLAVDSLGRVHYASQVRYPIGIYHTIWDHGAWSMPSLIYFIGSDDPDPSRIHAHNVRMAIRAGHQAVVAFTSSPADPQMSLYTIHSTLPDAPEVPQLPTPTVGPTSELTPTPGVDDSMNAATPLSPALASASTDVGQPMAGLVWGVAPALAALVGFVLFRMIRKR